VLVIYLKLGSGSFDELSIRIRSKVSIKDMCVFGVCAGVTVGAGSVQHRVVMPLLVVELGSVDLHRLEVLVALFYCFHAKLKLLGSRSRLVGVPADLFNCS
jgi:hypothetical protein